MPGGTAALRGGRRPLRRPSRFALIVAVIACLLGIAVVPISAALAADGSQFDPGNIITDAVFYDSTTMSADQIQAFLTAKVPSCGVAVCLPNYTETTVSRAATSYCAAYTGAPQTAAQIIFAVATACDVNPKALIVLLQKEQGLVTATAPTATRFQRATGFACPDTAPCDSLYFGFFNQVYSAASQFQRYRLNPASYGYRAGQFNTIQWSPNAACGSSSVYIVNQATAGLYDYTPYQPDAAALANMYGTGDACSSYGNRNFWAYFTDWFPAVAGTPPTVTANPTLGEPKNYLIGEDIGGAMTLHPGNGVGDVLPGGAVGAGWNTMSPVFSAGDTNGDGKQDILARDGAGVLWRYSRDGAGGWLPRVQVGTSWDKYSAIFDAGDFNGDKKPDLFAMDEAGRLWLYPGNGSGGWTARVQIGTSFDSFTALFGAGDFNGDGKADVLARDSAGNLWLYPGDGKGGWSLPRVAAGTGWQGYTLIGGHDFDGDGHPDVLAKDSTGKLWLYHGNGATGWKGTRTAVAGDWTNQVSIFAVGDATGVAVTPPASPSPTPTPTPSPSSSPTVPAGPPGVIRGDFTGDGIPDVLARNGTGPLTIFPGTAVGTLTTGVPASIGTTAYNLLFRVGDVTGDHLDDLIGRDASGALWLIPGNGASGFGSPVAIGGSWSGYSMIFGTGDFNGDGHPDIMARDSAGQLWLFPGTGTGAGGAVLGPRVLIGTSWNQFTAIIGAGDFNGDGKQDVFARDGAGTLWVYLGNGHGGWILPRVSAGTSWQTLSGLFTTDLSGDGKVDLIGRDAAGHMWIYKGNGADWWILPRIELGNGFSGYTWWG